MRVDRDNRDRLVEAINRYLDDDLTAFEFDELMFDIAEDSDDRTVFGVAFLLWYHYDDLTDHRVIASKEEWDYFQRLILLLRSDAHLERKARKIWSARQPLAALALTIFGLGVLCLGLSWHLLWFAVPLGGFSMLLTRWPCSPTPVRDQRWAALTPFVSISQLLTVRRRAADFSKRRYPPHLETRYQDLPTMGPIGRLIGYTRWLIDFPFELLWQAFPETDTEYKVVLR